MRQNLFILIGALFLCAALTISAQADLIISYDGNGLPQDQGWTYSDFNAPAAVSDGNVVTVTNADEARAWMVLSDEQDAELSNGWQIRATMSVPDASNQNNNADVYGKAGNPINQPTGEGGVDGLPSGGELWSHEVTLQQHDGGRLYRIGLHTDNEGNNDPIATFSTLNSEGGVTSGSAIHSHEVAGKAGQFVTIDMINETGGGPVDVYVDGIQFVDDVAPSAGWTGAPNQLFIGDCCGGNGPSDFSYDSIGLYVDRSGSGGEGLPGVVPEPATGLLFVLALCGLAGCLHRR